MIIMISVATTYFRTEYVPKELSGDMDIAIDDLLRLIYNCYEENEGKKGSVICYKIEINLDDSINESLIVDKLDEKRIQASQIDSDDLGTSGEIVIIYENQFINIRKVENERISS